MRDHYKENKLDRLRNGQKVLCDICKEGHYVPTTKSLEKALSFKCDKCGAHLMFEPVLSDDFRKFMRGE